MSSAKESHLTTKKLTLEWGGSCVRGSLGTSLPEAFTRRPAPRLRASAPACGDVPVREVERERLLRNELPRCCCVCGIYWRRPLRGTLICRLQEMRQEGPDLRSGSPRWAPGSMQVLARYLMAAAGEEEEGRVVSFLAMLPHSQQSRTRASRAWFDKHR